MRPRNRKAGTIETLLPHQLKVLDAARRLGTTGDQFTSGDLYQFLTGGPACNPVTGGNQAAGVGRTLRKLSDLGLLNRSRANGYSVPSKIAAATQKLPSFITPPTKAMLMAGRARV